jgi:hypothetical protein
VTGSKWGRDQNAESGQSDLVAMAFCLSLCPDYCQKKGAINYKKATSLGEAAFIGFHAGF